MIDDLQLAHDLAVAKLYGSDLPADELIEQYQQYRKEIESYLKRKAEAESKPKPATIMKSPF